MPAAMAAESGAVSLGAPLNGGGPTDSDAAVLNASSGAKTTSSNNSNATTSNKSGGGKKNANRGGGGSHRAGNGASGHNKNHNNGGGAKGGARGGGKSTKSNGKASANNTSSRATVPVATAVTASPAVAKAAISPASDASAIGHVFVAQYYMQLGKKPENLRLMYKESSQYSTGERGLAGSATVHVGVEAIHRAIIGNSYEGCLVELHTIVCQRTNTQGILITVVGELSTDSQEPRLFTQTFVLAQQQPAGYYVHNSAFLFLEPAVGKTPTAAAAAEVATPAVKDDVVAEPTTTTIVEPKATVEPTTTTTTTTKKHTKQGAAGGAGAKATPKKAAAQTQSKSAVAGNTKPQQQQQQQQQQRQNGKGKSGGAKKPTSWAQLVGNTSIGEDAIDVGGAGSAPDAAAAEIVVTTTNESDGNATRDAVAPGEQSQAQQHGPGPKARGGKTRALPAGKQGTAAASPSSQSTGGAAAVAAATPTSLADLPIDTETVWIKGVAANTTDDDLRGLLSKFGTITRVENNSQLKRYAVVDFTTVDEARAACADRHHVMLMHSTLDNNGNPRTRNVTVEPKRPRSMRQQVTGGGGGGRGGGRSRGGFRRGRGRGGGRADNN